MNISLLIKKKTFASILIGRYRYVLYAGETVFVVEILFCFFSNLCFCESRGSKKSHIFNTYILSGHIKKMHINFYIFSLLWVNEIII